MFGLSSIDLPPVAQFEVNADSLCQEGCLDLLNTSLGSPTSWEWSFPGSSTPVWSGPAPGPICYPSAGSYSYSLIVSNASGTDTAVGQVTVLDAETPDLGADTSFCQGDQVILQSSTAISNPLWNTGEIAPEITVTSPGIYWLESSGFCPGRDSILITENPIPTLTLGDPVQNICQGESLLLIAGPPFQNYVWNTGSIDFSLSIEESGLYTVTAESLGCTNQSSVQVNVDPCGCTVTIPNAFTPNNDGLNDLFRPVVNCVVERYLMRVWNRWGELIYQSEDASQYWDGTYRGQPQELGTFVWHLELTYQDKGKVKSRDASGTVTLIP